MKRLCQVFFVLLYGSQTWANIDQQLAGEMSRLRALSSQIELKLPGQKPEIHWVEDEVSLGQAAPVRPNASRPLVQADIELENLPLGELEEDSPPKAQSSKPLQRRFRGR